MNDRMCLRNKVALVTGAGWPMTALGPSRRRRATSKSGHARMPPKADVNSDTGAGWHFAGRSPRSSAARR